MSAPFDSPWYPYERVQTGFNTMRGAETIPYKIITYLLDLPDKAGYIPTDDNVRARVRLMKYLWHDGDNPLNEDLPTPTEKLSLLFDPEEPVVNTDEQEARHPKGYRLYPQEYWGQSELTAKSVIKCYVGRIIPNSPYRSSIGLIFEIYCNVNQNTNTRTTAYSRAYDIEQCIVEALNGVNISGVGVVSFDRTAHLDNGSFPIADKGTHVGRELRMSIDWMESAPESETVTVCS